MKEVEEKEIDLIKDPKICFMSNYPPKECGIATFTRDLVVFMNRSYNPKLRSRVIALNDPATHYNYDKRVILGIDRENKESYREVARKINDAPDLRLVCIEHEFGIFSGGNYGENLLTFLEEIKKPVVVTFHSVLSNPNNERKDVVKKIASKCAAIIVMAQIAVDILNKEYEIEKNKIHVIHHGIPNARFVPQEPYKKKLGLENKTVILTFGLLSRGKGIEYMIKSLPSLVKKYPNLLYLVLGETHPNIRREEGESYRNELMDLVKKLKLENHVKFQNKYVTVKELVEYILACDIYAFTNLERGQITSGTLAYATGCGRPVISTPIVYAEELLAQDRGIIIKEFKNPALFTEALDRVLGDEELKNNMSEAAYAFGRQMTWRNVAARHLNVFNKVVKLREEITKKYPQIKLEYIKKLTDKFGCLQFAKGSTPEKTSGYTTDDNSRALIMATQHYRLFNSRTSYNFSKIYLNFLEKAQEKNGKFKNNFKNENEYTETYSDDSYGRALWALGYFISKGKNKILIDKAKVMFERSFRRINSVTSIRAKAFLIMGLYYIYQKFKDEKYIEKIKVLSRDLVNDYKEHSSENWHWFEDQITYDNARIPESLFFSYMATGVENYKMVAEKTLQFISEITFHEDELHPIGQNGWFTKDGKRSFFDQQPIDASAMVSLYITAYNSTKDEYWYEKAVLAFNWFLGKNHLKQRLYDEGTGGCFDGLGKYALNLNQGAESTISYLMARLLLEETKKD